MKRLLFVSLGISFLLIALVGLFLGAGMFSEPKFEGSMTEWLRAEDEDIWAYLTDVKGLPNRRSEVQSIEILETFPDGSPKKWREIPNLGGYMVFEVQEKIKPKVWIISLVDSNFKFRGTWTYTLEKKAQGTSVTVKEESEIQSLLVRGATFLSGRDANLQKEMGFLRNRFSGR